MHYTQGNNRIAELELALAGIGDFVGSLGDFARSLGDFLTSHKNKKQS